MNNNLRVLRAERRWTQAELAETLDVSRQTINAIETGRFDPSLPLAFRIAQVFGRPIEAIFFPDPLTAPSANSSLPAKAASGPR